VGRIGSCVLARTEAVEDSSAASLGALCVPIVSKGISQKATGSARRAVHKPALPAPGGAVAHILVSSVTKP
jgi:hypothetical protein